MAIAPTPFTGSPDCKLTPVQDGSLICHSCGQRFAAGELEVTGLRRVEGGSDPAYQELLVHAVPPCPEGPGLEVPLRLGYGPTASRADSHIVEELPARRASAPQPTAG